MKKVYFLVGILVLCLAILAQEETHDVAVINIEVPVRVYKGNTFVDDLTIDDFEVYENGILQKIEAVYQVKKTYIQRKEEKKKFHPETKRSFYLFFEIAEYAPKLKDAMNYFLQNVLVEGDDLIVVTPMKTYRMKSETLRVLPKEEIVSQLSKILRKDAWMGSSDYRNAVNEVTGLVRVLAGTFVTDGESRSSAAEYEGMGLDELINHYAVLLNKLEKLRRVDQKKLLDFAEYLKDKEGQKYVFLFYQREFIPQIDPNIYEKFMSMYQDQPNIQLATLSLFGFYKRDLSFDVARVKQAYADSSISCNFLFFSKPRKYIFGVRMEEHSEDIFGAFREIAQATGGIVDSSANPEFLFQKAADASENYYLLYYSPKNYKKDGKFREIKVKVKSRNYRITHRAGYFAN